MLTRGCCIRYIPSRLYADYLKGLPRVGVSRFGKKKITPSVEIVAPEKNEKNLKKPSPPARLSGSKFGGGINKGSASSSTGNRFADMFSNGGNKKSQEGRNNRSSTQGRDTTGNVTNSKPTSTTATTKSNTNNANNKNKAPSGRSNEKINKKNDTKSSKTDHKKAQVSAPRAPIPITIPTFVTVSNLATIMNVYLNDLLLKLKELGFEDLRHNYILDKETATLIADEYNFEVTMNDDLGADLFPVPVVTEKLKPRAPIVTIMGHVDHGKTTILDYLRKSSIVAKEHGGITQHIGAFSVITPLSKKKITFLDTPGHAAFLKMRERGANITDIVILVVAADDSVMPQTIEAIKHAQKSGVPIIVAVNKCDKPTANPDKVIADVSTHGIEVEDYGGDTQTVRILGKTGLNMDKLEEAVITLSEMIELQAEEQGVPSEGWVIESQVQKGLGNTATVLVTRGTLKTGSFIVAGTTYCKIRGMKDELGKPVKQAGPATPVTIWGWKELPGAGDEVIQATTEQFAKKVCDNRMARAKQIQALKDIDHINAKRKEEVEIMKKQEKLNEMKLAGLTEKEIQEELDEEEEGSKKTCVVNFIIKADVYGSAEAIKESIDGLGNDEVKATVIFEEAGPPTESDLDRAEAANAHILCFNTKVPKDIQSKASKKKLEIMEHNVIYHLIEDVTKILTSKLTPLVENKILAEISLRDIFTITGKNKSKYKIAGCKVNTGLVKRQSQVMVEREGECIFKGKLSSLKHMKDDVSEVKKGTECGLSFEGWEDFQGGDVVKVYEEIVHQRYL